MDNWKDSDDWISEDKYLDISGDIKGYRWISEDKVGYVG